MPSAASTLRRAKPCTTSSQCLTAYDEFGIRGCDCIAGYCADIDDYERWYTSPSSGL